MRLTICLFLLSSLLFVGCQPASPVEEATGPLFLSVNNKYARIQAALYEPSQPGKIAIVHAHPWGNRLASFPAAKLAEEGFAVLGLDTRAGNKEGGQPNETFEPLLLDVAASV